MICFYMTDGRWDSATLRNAVRIMVSAIWWIATAFRRHFNANKGLLFHHFTQMCMLWFIRRLFVRTTFNAVGMGLGGWHMPSFSDFLASRNVTANSYLATRITTCWVGHSLTTMQRCTFAVLLTSGTLLCRHDPSRVRDAGRIFWLLPGLCKFADQIYTADNIDKCTNDIWCRFYVNQWTNEWIHVRTHIQKNI